MIYFVYVIINKAKKFYIGQTSNLESRLARHNSILPSKKSSFTKTKGSWSILYKEIYNTRQAAKQREKQLKSYQGRKFIKNIISLTTRR
jgi:putative endonuclease